jgi:hypothetical protein
MKLIAVLLLTTFFSLSSLSAVYVLLKKYKCHKSISALMVEKLEGLNLASLPVYLVRIS